MGYESSKKEEGANGRKLRAVAIVLIACVCGWFVMELEVLGVRVLAP